MKSNQQQLEVNSIMPFQDEELLQSLQELGFEDSVNLSNLSKIRMDTWE